MNKRKVVIIGAGHVGSHCAMALAFGGVCEEIVLLDTDLEKARANAMDVADACLFTPGSCTVHVGNYDDCKTADIIVISVGQPRKPGQTRLDMLDDSVRMLRDVCSHLKPLDYQGIVITITNPADIIADFTRKSLGLPLGAVLLYRHAFGYRPTEAHHQRALRCGSPQPDYLLLGRARQFFTDSLLFHHHRRSGLYRPAPAGSGALRQAG